MDLIKTPEFGESVFEASVGAWFKREGDEVAEGEAIVELHTDKAVQEINAVRNGVLGRILKAEDDVVQPGDVLCEFDSGLDGYVEVADTDLEGGTPVMVIDEEPAEGEPGEEPEVVDPASEIIEIEFSPMSEVGPVSGEDDSDDLSVEPVTEVQTTPQVTRDPEPTADVAEQSAQPQPSIAASLAGILDAEEERPAERVKLSRRRLTTARRMVQVQAESVMTTTFNEVDMHEVMRIRREHGEAFMASHGIKLGLMSFFVKAVITGLRSFPVLNAELDGDELVYKRYYDIGIAVASEAGLVVPVLRDADRMSFAGVEMGISEFAEKAKTGSFSLKDLIGGTFTITNGGVFGSMMSTPILNPPQVGILGMHNIVQRPIAIEGEVVVRPMMYLAVTYDHRVVEGAQAVQFLRAVKESLESAERLLLGT